ncbi:unnamed protein product [Prunus armeniaca]|uniref:Uncharacterized protein n=1 Tax=Prunus armeniaca TaxID=36596 RepID=A0A6J5W4C2_PRUAR|nr:unnamed protein product [Prunus armeniaca]
MGEEERPAKRVNQASGRIIAKVRPLTPGGSLRGMSGARKSWARALMRWQLVSTTQPNTDSSGRDKGDQPTLSFPRDSNAHPYGPNGMVTFGYDNNLALVELNFPSQIVRHSNWKGPLSFEQVMDLRRAQISMGHQYIMDWDTPGPSMRAPSVEDNNPYIGPTLGTLLILPVTHYPNFNIG